MKLFGKVLSGRERNNFETPVRDRPRQGIEVSAGAESDIKGGMVVPGKRQGSSHLVKKKFEKERRGNEKGGTCPREMAWGKSFKSAQEELTVTSNNGRRPRASRDGETIPS